MSLIIEFLKNGRGVFIYSLSKAIFNLNIFKIMLIRGFWSRLMIRVVSEKGIYSPIFSKLKLFLSIITINVYFFHSLVFGGANMPTIDSSSSAKIPKWRSYFSKFRLLGKFRWSGIFRPPSKLKCLWSLCCLTTSASII